MAQNKKKQEKWHGIDGMAAIEREMVAAFWGC